MEFSRKRPISEEGPRKRPRLQGLIDDDDIFPLICYRQKDVVLIEDISLKERIERAIRTGDIANFQHLYPNLPKDEARELLVELCFAGQHVFISFLVNHKHFNDFRRPIYDEMAKAIFFDDVFVAEALLAVPWEFNYFARNNQFFHAIVVNNSWEIGKLFYRKNAQVAKTLAKIYKENRIWTTRLLE